MNAVIAPGADVLCAGMLIADVFVPPVDFFPEAGKLTEVNGFVSSPGGCAANTAIALSRLGVHSALAATVGHDNQGFALRTNLDLCSVDTSGISVSALHPTSQTVILSVKGEDRRYFHEVGANAALTVSSIKDSIGNAKVLVIGGYFALPGLDTEALVELLSDLQSRGVITVLDIVIPSDNDGVAQLEKLLPHIDFFLPNFDEAKEITGKRDPVEQATLFVNLGCTSVVITCGQDGAVYADAQQIIHVKPLPVISVDPSGAGDAFTAGLVVGILQKWPIEQSLRFASAVGGSACRGLGCASTLFSTEEALSAAEEVQTHSYPNTNSST